MKKFTLLIILLMSLMNKAQNPRAYLKENVSHKFAALGTIGDDMHFISDSPITSGENAGAIDPNNPSNGYVLDDTGNLYRIEIETGTYTLLGNMLSDWRGMEFDRATGILYAITASNLYIIDPVAVTFTLVGSLGFNDDEHPIALGIYEGTGYIIESHKENSYTVNLTTGAATLLGALFPNGSNPDAIGDMGGMDGLTVIYTAHYQYRHGFKSFFDPITGSLGGGVYIDSPNVYNQEYGWFSYGELVPDVSTCPQPVFIDAATYDGTEIDFFWINFSEEDAVNGYDWQIFYKGEDPDTATPLQTGHTPQHETAVKVTGLISGYFYDFYVIRDCAENGTSIRSTRKRVQTMLQRAKCGVRNFYDDGGGNESYYSRMTSGMTYTIRPDNEGEGVEVSFLDFDLQNGHDVLYVYDGPNRFFPLIDSGQPATETGFPAGGFTGTTLPGTFRATHRSGRLTFVLYSDNEYTLNEGWNATVNCFQLRPPNDLIANAYDIHEINGFPYRDQNAILQYATEETIDPNGCEIIGETGVWYKFTAEEAGTVFGQIVTPSGETKITFYTAPDENATESDLTLVDQPTNNCDDSNISSITTEAGMTYYVYAVNTGGETDVYMTASVLDLVDNNLKDFKYYPNPTSGKLTLDAPYKIDSVVIFDMLGKIVFKKDINSANAQIDLANIADGVYVMQVETNGQRGAYKIIKK